MTAPAQRMTQAAARRAALAAQGFADPRPSGRVDRRHLRRVLDRVGLIQIDSVNVLVRSQELPLFARLGPHPRSLIPDATRAGELFEYWGHEASHIPSADHRLYRWRMQAATEGQAWSNVVRMQRERPDYVEQVYRRIEVDGPVTAGDLSERTGPKGTWWDWDHAKLALEHLFWTGRVTAVRRPSDFARVYDLPDRVLPRAAIDAPTPTADEARKELLVRAARSMGVATHQELADYHRQNVPTSRPALAALVYEGRLVPVDVDGWRHTAYALPEVRVPRSVRARALLSPFDSLVWNRARTERVFGFEYRIEIYTPAPKRRFGYYVLPFLLGEHLVARVDLKADRAAGVLRVPGAHAEAHLPAGVALGQVADELAAELVLMAGWLGLERIEVGDRGDLAGPLARSVRAGRR